MDPCTLFHGNFYNKEIKFGETKTCLNSNSSDISHNFRDVLAYVFIPVIQKELDIFSSVNWNEHRGRKQKDKILPTGIPNLMYDNPEEFGGIQCGIPIDEDLLEKVNDKLDIMTEDHDWMSPELRELCEELLPYPEDIPPSEASEEYILLKTALESSESSDSLEAS